MHVTWYTRIKKYEICVKNCLIRHVENKIVKENLILRGGGDKPVSQQFSP